MTPAGRLIFALAAAAMPVVAAQASAATAKPAARIDWTRTFAVTPAGGFRMGNPKAKVSLIEYGSLTCPHCRHFAQTGVKPLIQNYVRSGKVSYEYRSLVLDGTDLTATLVLLDGSRFEAEGTARRLQPNGSGCEPTCFRAELVLVAV